MIRNYTAQEIVEYNCDKCSLLATLAHLKEQQASLENTIKPSPKAKKGRKSAQFKVPTSSPTPNHDRNDVLQANIKILENRLQEGKYDEKLVRLTAYLLLASWN